MKQEFVTLYGKAIIEGETLYLRSPYLPFGKTAFAQIGYEVCFILVFIFQIFRKEGPFYYVGILVWGSLLAFRTPEIYDALIKRSYANRISLNRIQSATISNDSSGLQTFVTLHVKNGRYRKIIFRRLENQYEPFTELILQSITHPQLA